MHTDETKGDGGVEQAKHHGQHPTPPPTSISSSPSHDFSFAISLRTSKNNTTSTFTAVDLSPADEIFFHGHLLPLHLLSHLPASPRSSSANSMDGLKLPAMESLSSENGQTAPSDERSLLEGGRAGGKSKSFSLFGMQPKRRNGPESAEGQKRKSKFDHVSRFVAKYVRLMRPLVTALRNRRENCSKVENLRLRNNYGSFSTGNLKLRSRFKGLRGRNEFSAPSSTRNSPTNSGLLVSTEHNNNNTSDSTMEELQAAIQSAIAHCKNSIDGGEDKNKNLP